MARHWREEEEGKGEAGGGSNEVEKDARGLSHRGWKQTKCVTGCSPSPSCTASEDGQLDCAGGTEHPWHQSAISRRAGDPGPDIRLWVLEGALFCADGRVARRQGRDAQLHWRTYGIQRPTPFICLVCKLLQIQPDKEIVLEYLQFEEFKYLRAVAALYVRLTFPSLEVYEVLEPMLNDYRKLRFRQMSGSYTMTFMDEYVYDLLTKERVCELILPRLTRRDVLEDTEGLTPRTSKLEEGLLERDSDAASDDSAVLVRKNKQERAERAKRVRQEREAQDNSRIKEAHDFAMEDRKEDHLESAVEGEYPSQEESGEEDRYVSRSPSVESDRGYQSRSPSRSPDR
ncbi:hypothetical protein L7F22_049397 [Adiantum nelumboides]|nr:hypothetical protein [Adiantum nelumboides]